MNSVVENEIRDAHSGEEKMGRNHLLNVLKIFCEVKKRTNRNNFEEKCNSRGVKGHGCQFVT